MTNHSSPLPAGDENAKRSSVYTDDCHCFEHAAAQQTLEQPEVDYNGLPIRHVDTVADVNAAPEKAAASGIPSLSESPSIGAPSAASPLDYPGIPEDLRRQMREERRELVEALREARPYVEEDEDGNLRTAKWAIDFLARIDAILAREGEKHE